jgi:hypothetical protein
MTLAILCSGEGPKNSDMFALTGETSEAANVFAHAATLLGGRDPREMVQTDTYDFLHQNRVGQILCTLQALAATARLRDKWPRRLIVAGYSVGEVAAKLRGSRSTRFFRTRLWTGTLRNGCRRAFRYAGSQLRRLPNAARRACVARERCRLNQDNRKEMGASA